MIYIFITPSLKMFLEARAHLYRQHRLHVNLRDLNKTSHFELAKCVQKVTEKQDLPPDPSTNDSGTAWGNSDSFYPQSSLMENKTSVIQRKGPFRGLTLVPPGYEGSQICVPALPPRTCDPWQASYPHSIDEGTERLIPQPASCPGLCKAHCPMPA